MDDSTVYADLLLGIADAVAAVDARGRIVLWNAAAEAMFGYSRDQALEMLAGDLISDRFVAEFSQGFQEVLRGVSRPAHSVAIARTAAGNDMAIEIATSVAVHKGETIIIGILRKLKDRFRSLAFLRENQRRLQEAEQLAGMGSFQWNVGSDEIAWSDQLARLYGYEPGAHPKSLAAFLERVHPDDRDTLQRQIGQALHDGSSWTMEERIIRADTGETRTLLSEVRAIRDSGGRVVRLCGICHDITESRRAEEALATAEARLRERTLYDPLTSMPNRILLLDRLGAALRRAQREGSSLAVLLFDLDNFSLINDTIGHVGGDAILQTVAQRLLAAARTSDSVARTGGDEFVMIVEGIDSEDVIAMTRRIAAKISSPITVGSREITITPGVGIAMGQGRESAEHLLHDADLALTEAKKSGKNAIELFDETLRRDATDRVSVEGDLRRALLEDQIEPFYQPIFDLNDNHIVGFEALARWNHPERGLLAPIHFLSVAEDTHLIGALGETMLRKACRQLALWQRTDASLTMAVNLSLRQVSREFVSFVESLVRESGIAPRSLRVEVTESVLLDMHTEAASYLNMLAGLGVQVGIDDFGTGYSSLLYLKRFPVRFLKIDRSFVEGLPDSAEDAAIVTAIVRLAESLELNAIAEGVETVQQLKELQWLGCKFAQGYYLSMPLSAAECGLMLPRATA